MYLKTCSYNSMSMIKQSALIVLLLVLGGNNAYSETVHKANANNQSSQEWVVVLKDPRPARLQGWKNGKYKTGANYYSGLELKRIGSRFAKKNSLKLKQEWFIESLSVYCLIVEFNEDTHKTLESLENNQLVEWVQKSNDFELLNSTTNESASPNSNSLNKTAFSYDGEGIVIAMIDSRIDQQHQDLSHAIKGVADFVITKKNGRNSTEAEVHGTAMAGVLVAQPNEQFGITGIAPAAKLLAFRGCWEESSTVTNCNTLSLARALDEVIKLRPDILNLSLSGPHDPLLNKLIDKIVKQKTAIVAAFDPQRANSKRFPVPRKGVLIVRAENLDEIHESEFTAPGAQIVTTPDDNYTYLTGHSIASAHTSGLLALLTQARTQNPRMKKTIDMVMSGELSSSRVLLDRLSH